MSLVIEILKAVLLGVVEGVTEWLPISSTGHMILVDEFVSLDVSGGFMELFLVVIQLGAILAVLVLYFGRLNPLGRGKDAGQRRRIWLLWAKVAVASVPAAVIGVLLDDWVEERFYNSLVVALTLVLYGVAFIVVERVQGSGAGEARPRRGGDARARQGGGSQVRQGSATQPRHFREEPKPSAEEELERMSWAKALGIGFFQCLAIVPGTSRSGSTILGGRLLGISRQAAAEFSFFLAIPVMFGWSILKAVKALLINQLAVSFQEWMVLAVGVSVAFAVSIVVIRFLIGYVQRKSFTVFGWYRIALGVVVLVYFWLS